MESKIEEKKVNKTKKSKKNKSQKVKRRNILFGLISIQASFNNTIVTIADDKGNVISWSSSGERGFKGSKKSTPFAAQQATVKAIEKAREYGFQFANVKIVGVGAGRDSALRAIQSAGINIKSIEDITYLPHNGCRPPKRRRQ